MTIGFIGAGRVGTSFGKYFTNGGIKVSGYYSRSKKSAQEAANFLPGAVAFDTMEELVNRCDIIFITTDDDNILPAWKQLYNSGVSLDGKIICHASGCVSSKLFEGIESTGAIPASLHMMVAVHDRFTGYKNLENAVFTVEGEDRAVQVLSKIMRSLGNPVTEIDADAKPLYHAAAVMSANFVCALLDLSSEMLMRCGFDRRDAESILIPLALSAAESAAEKGIAGGLTGPVERNDADTVTAHLGALCGKEKQIYTLLSERLIKIAESKNPDFDYSRLKKELM